MADVTNFNLSGDTISVKDYEARRIAANALSMALDAMEEAKKAVTAYTKAESDARYAPIASAIKVSGKGTGLVSLTPTVAWGMQGLTLYGRSTQDGMPGPESPVPIVSAGQSGMVDATVCKKNLFDGLLIKGGYNNTASRIRLSSAQTLKAIPGQKYFLSIDSDVLQAAVYIVSSMDQVATTKLLQNTGFSNNVSLDVSQSGFLRIIVRKVDDSSLEISDAESAKIMLNVGDAAQPYQPYAAQQLTIPTPDGLPGIPVDSGGNWTDESGHQWASDVVDLVAGTKTQYCGQIASYNGESITTPYISSTGSLTTGAQVVYVLPEPATTPLGSSTIAAYKALQSYPGTTNIQAPDCGIEASAVGNATEIIGKV